MGIDTTKAHDHPTTNALASIPDDLLSNPPAYYKLGITPAPVEDPLAAEDSGIYCVRIVCTGEHGPLMRGDGERRFERSMKIQAIWKLGDPTPPDPDEEQPGLFDDGDQPTDGEPESLGDIMDNVARPDFSSAGDD